jgi:hypothetical protein
MGKKFLYILCVWSIGDFGICVNLAVEALSWHDAGEFLPKQARERNQRWRSEPNPQVVLSLFQLNL